MFICPWNHYSLQIVPGNKSVSILLICLILLFYPGFSFLVQLSLRLSLQLSCGPVEAISIRETLTETSLQLRGPGCDLESTEVCGKQARSHHQHRSLSLTQPLSLPPSLLLCGPKCWPFGRDGRGGQSPNPTYSVSEAMHFPDLSVQRQRESLSLLWLVSAYC